MGAKLNGRYVEHCGYRFGHAASTGPHIKPTAVRKQALETIAQHPYLHPIPKTPALCNLFITHFTRGWYDAERARQDAEKVQRASAYQADVARLKRTLEALE